MHNNPANPKINLILIQTIAQTIKKSGSGFTGLMDFQDF
jgi:hypothetical protein